LLVFNLGKCKIFCNAWACVSVCVGFVMRECRVTLYTVHWLTFFSYPDWSFSSGVRQMPGQNSKRRGKVRIIHN
jgi:hypothetical protein